MHEAAIHENIAIQLYESYVRHRMKVGARFTTVETFMSLANPKDWLSLSPDERARWREKAREMVIEAR